MSGMLVDGIDVVVLEIDGKRVLFFGFVCSVFYDDVFCLWIKMVLSLCVGWFLGDLILELVMDVEWEFIIVYVWVVWDVLD